MLLLTLNQKTVKEQLTLEEKLLRHGVDNFCLVHTNPLPAIVMGISNDERMCIHLDRLPSNVPVVRRFSGGGTVVIDENTIFITFICNKRSHPFPAYPEAILRWSASIFGSLIKELRLCENDFIIEEKKCAGNALYIKKDRWLIHTSFLWDFDSDKMSWLKYPPKAPKYRQGRAHKDFLFPLSSLFENKQEFVKSFEGFIQNLYPGKSITETELSYFFANSIFI